jgi:hypothetical protein
MKIQARETVEDCSAEFGVRRLGRGVVVLGRRGFVEENVGPRGQRRKCRSK